MRNATQSPLLEQALAASAADDTEQAIQLFRRACADAPADPVAPFLLGAELAQARRYDEAERAYATAVAMAPGFAIARYELGTLQFTSSRAEAALITWQPLLDLPVGEPLRLFVQGYAALAQDRSAQAIGFFEQGITANQSNAALNANIRLLIDEIGKTAAACEQSISVPKDEAAGAHVLLDAYRRQLS